MTHTKSTKATKEMLSGRSSHAKTLCEPLWPSCEAKGVTHIKSAKAAKEMLKGDFFDGRVILDGAVDDSLDAVFQVRCAEVDQQTKPSITQPKLSQQLLAVQWLKRLDRLQLDNESVSNEQVGAETFFEGDAVVRNGNRFLPFDRDTVLTDLIGEQDFIDRFQKTRPKSRVQLVGPVKHDLGKLVLVHRQKGSHNGPKVRNVKKREALDPKNLRDLCVLCVRPSS